MVELPEEMARWLTAARAGSRDDLGRALEACRAYLLGVACRKLDADLHAKGGASDLVQETFLEAQRDFARFQGNSGEELLAWLRQLLLHNVADFTRRYRDTAGRAVDREVPLDAGGSSGGPAQIPTGAEPSASARARAGEQAEALQRALGRLPEDYRRVILLRYQQQRSFEEIGRAMQRTTKAARMLWARAVKQLRQELGVPP
jgi:RNA polymerase sigma-70 factor (ECF subfamily)